MEPLRKRPVAKQAVRGNDLARIHILKKDARLTDDEYRDLLQALTGKRSAADLSFEERARVCTHLTTLAHKLNPNAMSVKRSRARLAGPQAKVFAMWKALEKNGTLWARNEKSLRAFVRRMTDVDDLAFCTNDDCTKLINSLFAWGQRTGADVERR